MKKIFFIGDVSLDEYYTSDRLPGLKDKVIVHSLKSMMGGSIANAACVCAALGSKPEFFTALNSGFITRELLTGLNKAGVGTEHMVYDNSIPDSKCIILLCQGEHTVLIPTLGIQRFEISEHTLSELMDADLIYTNFCEIGPMACGDMDSKAILKMLRENGVKVFCDADCGELSRRDEELLPYMDTVMINETGNLAFREKFGTDYARKLLGGGISQIIVTMAENGCALFTKDGKTAAVPGVRVESTDVTGAGDTFGASFVHAMSISADLEKCASFANYMAARSVTGMGARYGCCTKDEIMSFIEDHGGNLSEFEIFIGEQ